MRSVGKFVGSSWMLFVKIGVRVGWELKAFGILT